MAFYQSPPTLGDQFAADRVLRSYLRRRLPAPLLERLQPELSALGALAGGHLYQLQQADRLNEPRLTQWDAWGQRCDHIEVTPLWREAAPLAAQFGLVASAYEPTHDEFEGGALRRVHQFAMVYLFEPSSDVYSCPLAMTDGAARTLLAHQAQAPGGADGERLQAAFSRLTSRDPQRMWTSGQWMTERTGGSDVGLSETEARRDGEGRWRLHGTKWFTSATTSQMALTLARPTGAPSGGRGLGLFFVELRDAAGRLQGISINRLKDKLGTRKVPTAELTLDGAPALPVIDQGPAVAPHSGVRLITPMLNITRTWNSVCAVAGMRRALALARDYARRRHAFGALLADKPLHNDTLAGLQAEFEGAFHLVFRVVELLGAEQAGLLSPAQAELLRLLTPIMKLTTGRQAVALASEALEAFGGAGYVEDTGLPRLLRDSQVLPIWEGTTNVLSLDTLRALGSSGAALLTLRGEVAACLQAAREPSLVAAGQAALAAVDHAIATAQGHAAQGTRGAAVGSGADPALVEAGARRFALTLGRATELALLVRHAQWSLDVEGDGRAAASARRLWRNGVDLIGAFDASEYAGAAAALADSTLLSAET